MKPLPALLSLGIALLLPASAPAKDLLEGLSPSQISALESGEMLHLTEEVPGKPWPRTRVFKYVEASPWEVMAVFSDYENASAFIPNVEKSQVRSVVHPREKEVYYELDLPMLPNECYTARNLLALHAGGTQLEASWTVQKGRFIQSSVGNLLVQPMGRGSLLCYTNLVDPGSKIAVLLRSHAKKQVEDTVAAIASEVLRLKRRQPEKLAEMVRSLEIALAPTSPR